MALPPITFTAHCVDRYIERVRAVSPYRARSELALLLGGATVRPEPPPSITPERREDRCAAWLWLDDTGDLCAPLLATPGGGYVAVSLLVRGGISGLERQRRNKYKAYGRRSKHGAAKRTLQDPPRPRAGPEAGEW